jgi:hypothetical protein
MSGLFGILILAAAVADAVVVFPPSRDPWRK